MFTEKEKESYRTGLIFACIGAVLTMIGDWLIGANPPSGTMTGIAMLDVYADAFRNSAARMVTGGMLGAIGIPVTGLGYIRISEILLKEKKGFLRQVYRAGTFAFISLAGTGVHLACAVIPMLYQWIAAVDTGLAAEVAFRYMMLFMNPPMIIFGVLLFAALVYQAVVIVRKETPYPAGAVFYNLVFGIIAAQALSFAIGKNVIGNGIGTCSISIGHLWMFLMLLIRRPEELKTEKERTKR